MSPSKIKITLLSFLMILLFSGLAFGYSVLIDGTTYYFEYKRTITIQSGQVPSSQTNFPMLFDSTTKSGLPADLVEETYGGKVRNPNGDDIVFALNDGVEILKHEVEEYDEQTGDYIAWVRIPSISNGAVFYVYYGCDQEISFPANFTTDVWDTDYASVWHLEETDNPATVTYYFNGTLGSQWINWPNFHDGNLTLNAYSQVNAWTHTFGSNNCPATDLGTITKVELRVHGGAFTGGCDDDIILQPIFGGGDGNEHQLDMVCATGVEDCDWSAYTEITTDTNAPSPWTWTDVQNLRCRAKHKQEGTLEFVLGIKCEIRVTYTSGGTDAIKDSTSNNNDGTNSVGLSLGVTGKMDGAVNFDGSSDYITFPNLPQPAIYFTISAWIKVNSSDSGEVVSGGDSYCIRLYSPGQIQFSIREAGTWDNHNPAGQEITDFTEFHYIACGVNGPSLPGPEGSFYTIDGVNLEQNDDEDTVVYDQGTTVEIGRHGNGSSSYDFSGTIDEVRISTVGRLDDWIETEYNSQNDPGSFYSVGDPWATLVELSYFKAKSLDSAVLLEWATETELDNGGFNILRDEEEDGEYVRINPYLIPARGLAGFGAEYSYTDYDVENDVTYYYLLEDVDFYGKSTYHGPISATPNDIILIWPPDWEPLDSGASLFSWTSSGSFSFKIDVSTEPSFSNSETITFPEGGWISGHSLWLCLEEWEMIIRKVRSSDGHLFWRIRAKSSDGRVVCSDWKKFEIDF